MQLRDTIGKTPLVELSHFSSNEKVRLFAKLEGNNPAGSVKDRPAFHMLREAWDRGELKKGSRLVEATSGNTGIALAMAARLFELQIELVMPADASKERVLSMQAYGAKVILTPAEDSMEGSIDLARQMVRDEGYIMLDQFSNADNWKSHALGTGPEIWEQTEGKITHFVSSMGTTGTIMGVSRALKKRNKAVTIVGVQPTENSNIPGIRRWPKEYLPAIFDESRVDRIMDVSEKDAVTFTRSLAKKEGVFAGMSSGGALVAAQRLCKELEEGFVVLIVCDRGDRYLSTSLFDEDF